MRLTAWSRTLTCQKPKQSLLGKRRMTRRGQRRPRAYPATKQQPRVKLRLPRVLPRMHNIKGLRANQKETQQFRPRAASQKKWVEDTERVWVVDREAWTESVPIYSTVEVSICNICGTDITGNTSAHAKEHMKAGEGSGHHSEIRQIVTGYNTVSHKEEGHWETKVVGGHWE